MVLELIFNTSCPNDSTCKTMLITTHNNLVKFNHENNARKQETLKYIVI